MRCSGEAGVASGACGMGGHVTMHGGDAGAGKDGHQVGRGLGKGCGSGMPWCEAGCRGQVGCYDRGLPCMVCGLQQM